MFNIKRCNVSSCNYYAIYAVNCIKLLGINAQSRDRYYIFNAPERPHTVSLQRVLYSQKPCVDVTRYFEQHFSQTTTRI